MLRAVIFDDEYIVTQGMRAMIDWGRYGIELAGTAGDGLSALGMVRDLKPDIVMTDIRMPGMDGLKLIEAISEEAPDTVCVVFSGFNEFDYIRKALKLGVVDYIEKPVTIEKVDEAMRRTIERIGRRREHMELKDKLEASKEALLEKATRDLVLLGEEALPAWRRAFGEEESRRVVGVTALAGSAPETLEALDAAEPPDEAADHATDKANAAGALGTERAEDASEMTIGAMEAADSLDARSSKEARTEKKGAEARTGDPVAGLSPPCRSVLFPNGNEWVAVVFHYALPADSLWERLELRSTHMNGTVGSGLTYAEVKHAGRSCKEALRALRYGLFLEEKGWTRFEHAEENESFPEGLSEREEELVFLLRTGNREALRGHLEAVKRWMESERLNPDLAERELLKLAYLGLQVAKESGLAERQAGIAEAVPHRELGGLRTRDEMFRWLSGYLGALMDGMAESKRTSKHAAVDKALAFIEKNYDRDLTLQEVAEHVGMNATYFSLLFKEKVGHSYIKHVTKLRLEQAKVYLRRGMKVNEASEKVGYYNYRHFTELFKKHVGLTPGQYRESRGTTDSRERGDRHD